MLLKTLKTCLFLCLVISAKAQNFVDATIFKLNGDSISGQINYQEWYINPAFITFRTAKSAKTQEFRPKDISKFVIKSKNEIYESATVDIHFESMHDLEHKDVSPSLSEGIKSIKFDKETVFLLLLAKGKVSLYHYVDKSSLEHYFMQKGNKEYIELLNLKFRIMAANGKFYLANYEDYKTKLAALSVDCPKINDEFGNLEFKESKLQDIVALYNNYVGKQEYTKLSNKKVKAKYYAFTGISLPRAFVAAPYFGQFKTIKGKLTVPLIGAGIEIGMGRELSPTKFGAELNVASNVYDYEISTSNGRLTRYEANLLGIHLMPYMKGSFYNKKKSGQSLFFKIGLPISYYIKANYQQSYIPAIFNSTDVFSVKKTSVGIAFSGGYKIKQLFLEGKLEPYTSLIVEKGTEIFMTIRTSFVVGYFF